VIHPNAFRKTLAERGGKVRFLWQHDPGEPLGKPLEMHEDEKGLFVRAAISDTARGRDALALLKDEAIEGLSIGYDPVKGGTDYTKDDGTGDTTRNLRELKLWEFSLATFPANEEAQVTAVKEDPTPGEAKPAPDVTENTVRIRVRDPGDFQDGSFRTITIGDEDQGIQAVIGKPKGETSTEVQSYVFDKEKWDVERAQAWVDENKKDAVPDLDEKQVAGEGEPAPVPTEVPGEDDGVQEDTDAPAKSFDPDAETKVGRVLSAANAGKLVSALTTVLEVLEAAGVDVPGYEKQPSRMPPKEEGGKAAPVVFNVAIYDEETARLFLEAIEQKSVNDAPATEQVANEDRTGEQAGPSPDEAPTPDKGAGPQKGTPTSNWKIALLEMEHELNLIQLEV